MKNSDELLKQDQKSIKRKVAFLDCSFDQTKPQFTPYHNRLQKPPNFNLMKKKFMLLLQTGQDEVVRNYLQSHTLEDIQEFLLIKGESICDWTLICCASPDPFATLVHSIPNDILYNVLSKDNFAMLLRFFRVQSILDQDGHYNPERIATLTNKIKSLLSLNNIQINKVIEDSGSADFLTNTVKQTIGTSKLMI